MTIDDSIADKREKALQCMQKQREKWKKRFDAKHRKPMVYQVDDLVVIENDLQATGESRKLDIRYRGPYVVTKVLGNDRYLIEDIDGMQHKQKRFCSVYASDKIKPGCIIQPELDEHDSDEDESSDIETMLMSELAELSRTTSCNPATSE
ncbi:PREDICTED: uncharacterized protein LOC108362045 [Rhagoletis zephyria]|uniref:uncharacterized protein LOC108362045 n=1 Tax=Rhagoletis zephyria TaxID=28612 RepID=UPI000811971C|nr:PREDICTED: uncharacterized protein LOC108362045 [Rhagoletis zephyria]